MRKNIYLYGFAGPKDNFRVVKYWRIDADDLSILELRYVFNKMFAEWPNIQVVYALDSRYGLRREYQDAIRSNNMEGWVLFKDTCEREGIEVQR